MPILAHLPDSDDPCRSQDAPCRHFGARNMVVSARSRGMTYPKHRGPLSIKCAFGGAETYEIDGRRCAVDDRSYLVLNEGQDYASRVDEALEVESFCVFFREGFAQDVLASLIRPADNVIDDPHARGSQPILFFDKVYSHDALVSPILGRLRTAGKAPVTSGWIEERMHELLVRLLRRHRGVSREIELLPAARRSTRIEQYRRLHRAKDFIDSSLADPVDLASMASIACMEPHHFLRSFTRAFGTTPHQYLTTRRLEKARVLLKAGSFSVTDVCLDVGFSSLGSFSWLFRRRYGVPPGTLLRR